MATINWTNEFSVGVKTLDEQHIKIIELINKLVDLHTQALDKNEIRSIMSDLVTYGFEHLHFEEELLQQHEYPDFIKHKHEHILYTKKVTDYMKNISQINEDTLQDITDFLNEWWTHHILEEDMKYSHFFRQKGVH